MPRFRRATPVAAALALGLMAHAHAATVAVLPKTASLAPLTTRQFQASVTGATGTSVTWLVNGIPGGAPSVGLISATGLYTAPADVPAAVKVEVEAQSVSAKLDYGAASVSLAASVASGPVFHVATTGKDSNAGTAAAPWRTLQHAADTVPAGGTVEVASGVYNELVTLTRSGNATAGFITLRAAPGATPIVDGTGLPIPNGEAGLFTLTDVSFVRIIGFSVRNYRSASAANDPVGIYVTGAGRNIEIKNNVVFDIATTVTSSNGDALGIAVYGTRAPAAISNLIIDGNELRDLTTGFSESLAISGNVQNFQVTNNLIHDNNNIGIDIAGYENEAPQAFDRADHGWIAGNTVFNISSRHNPAYGGDLSADGIYVDGGENIVIERNLVHNTDIGIEAASEHQRAGQPVFANNVTIRDNVVYASNIVGITIGGYANGVGGTQGAVIVNNTLVGDDTTSSGSGELQIQFHASGNVFYNNIAVATGEAILLNSFVKLPNPPALLDHNRYSSPIGADNSQWLWLNKTWTGFAAYVKNTPNDHHGSFGAPGFVNAAAHDYQLATGAPARNTGALLPLSQIGLFDFAGKPRVVGNAVDLGAYQD